MSQATVHEHKAPAKFVGARDEAIATLQAQLTKGVEIKGLRIRSAQELDRARAIKLEWITHNTELLKQWFDNSSVADECNDWVGKVYPEYAEFGNFIEQFYTEMDHRLRRLKHVLKRIEQTPVAVAAPAPEAATPMLPVGTPPVTLAAAAGGVKLAPAAPAAATPPGAGGSQLRGILLARGTDQACQDAVSEFFESLEIELMVIETAAESLDHTGEADFAIVLAGPAQRDDGFELGFCVGRLGLKRVCVLKTQDGAEPAARYGLTHISLDAGGGWQLQVARHLRRAGLDIDLNRLC